MALSIDQLNVALGGRYRVEGVLGAGGMATVYTAHDDKHQRLVAIKVLHPAIAVGMSATQFLREIRIVAQFSHPGIIGLIDSGSLHIDGAEIPYYVMPRIEGETLRQRLQRGGAMAIDEAIELARQVADALAYAHAHDVIHRDIKPENILLVGNRALVADFGIAKAMGDVTASMRSIEGGMAGTPAYMSPEQVTEAVVGPATDIFSLGVTLYEMLTNELPYAGATPQAQLARRLNDTPLPVRTLRPTVPKQLDDTVARMLARFPADRLRSAADVADALAGRTPAPPTATRRWIGVGGVAAALLAVATFLVYRDRDSGNNAPITRSIAVLPFAYVGPDARSEYYGDGIADELAGALAKLPELKVAARSSAFQFKGRNVEAREIGTRLGVGAVVEGSVRPVGNMLRISAQLINTSDGLAVWSETYERPVDQVFNVQTSIIAAIAKALRIGNAPGARVVAPNSRAYEAYLQGRWHWGKRDREGFERAVQYFRLAIREDSLYARAWAGLGDAYSLLGGFGFMAPDEAFEQARAAANRAIVLDSSLADAHTALGFVHLFYDWDWSRAKTELETALRLDPAYGEARLFYAWYLAAMNQTDVAVDSLRAAVRDEPVSLILNLRLGSILLLAGRPDDAKKQLEHTLELSATYPLAHLDLAKVATVQGDYTAAFTHLERAPALVASYGSGVRGVALSQAGRRKEALAEVARLQRESGASASALGAAQTFAALGDLDNAFVWLERAWVNRDWALFFMRSDALLQPLHADPRWAAFVRRMRFP